MVHKVIMSVKKPEVAFYRFKNCSSLKINVYWSNPPEFIYYNCLAPEEFIDVNTYESHVWVFVNVENGNRLWADGHFEFYSKSWKKELQLAKETGLVDKSHWQPFRQLIKITHPLQKLTYLAMEVVRDSNISPEKISDLEIPITLQSDLKRMILIKQCMKQHRKECSCSMQSCT